MKDKQLNFRRSVHCKISAMLLLLAVGMQSSFSAGWAGEPITTISGQIQPGDKPDTLVFSYLRNYLYNLIGEEQTVVVCDKQGRFNLAIAQASSIGRLNILVKGSLVGRSLHHYLQKGDAINLVIQRGSKGLVFDFSGIGAGKLSAKNRLDSLTAQTVASMRNMPELTHQTGLSPSETLAVTFKRTDYMAKRKLELLKEMQDDMPESIYELMRVDIQSYCLERKYFNYWFAAKRNTLKADEQHLKAKFFELESIVFPRADRALFRISYDYMELLQRVAMVRDFFYGNKGLAHTYQLLKYGSPFAVRDRAITSYLLSNPKLAKAGEYEDCIRDAVATVKDSLDRKVVLQLLAAYRTGSQLGDYALTKTDGSSFSISEVSEKVLLVDFWFSGCTSCIKQTDQINRNIIPKLKAANSPVAILSVNLDKKRERWKESVQGGKYIIKGSIELFTGGLAFAHPMAKFYQVQSCPRLMVFDQKGNLVASDPDLGKLVSLIDSLVEK
ncbi:MAG: redoxin domain-containing protein [Pedobacter sp.]|nr:MAG: redoxin domain-containing protein [Pedobacter sp.]